LHQIGVDPLQEGFKKVVAPQRFPIRKYLAHFWIAEFTDISIFHTLWIGIKIAKAVPYLIFPSYADPDFFRKRDGKDGADADKRELNTAIRASYDSDGYSEEVSSL
jgi:hypothetical protein